MRSIDQRDSIINAVAHVFDAYLRRLQPAELRVAAGDHHRIMQAISDAYIRALVVNAATPVTQKSVIAQIGENRLRARAGLPLQPIRLTEPRAAP